MIPAAIAGWWCVVIVAIALHSLAFSFCAPADVVSGACVAPWFVRFETALLHVSVALSAILVVLIPAVLAPARRWLVAWVAYATGAIVALSVGALPIQVIVALASGFIAALLVSTLHARRAA